MYWNKRFLHARMLGLDPVRYRLPFSYMNPRLPGLSAM